MTKKLRGEVREVVIPRDLQSFLRDIVDGRNGFELGDPWRISDRALSVVVPIIRRNAPERLYVTMYEVAKELDIRDTGRIDRVEFQNRAGKPVFVRAGTIFEGSTQNRASEHSCVIQPGREEVVVRCVHQTHGISPGAEMRYGDIAPWLVTRTLLSERGQREVWHSVNLYIECLKNINVNFSDEEPQPRELKGEGGRGRPGRGGRPPSGVPDDTIFCGNAIRDRRVAEIFNQVMERTLFPPESSTDLLGAMRALGRARATLDDMMQRVPLFPEQVGAIIFDPLGVHAIECFDSPKSWEAIKKEVIERFGDLVSMEQAEHLFELRPDKIVPFLRKFIAGLEKFEERTVRRDDMSETRAVKGEGVVGEYTLVKNRVIHCILTRAG